MATVTITEVIDDLRAADEVLRRFERQYWLSSGDFYELYSRGMLDSGDHIEDFTQWAGFYEIKLDREETLSNLSQQRLDQLRQQTHQGLIQIESPEPKLSTTT